MATRDERELHELLWIEEADAWFEYADATRGEVAGRYAEIEPWAWARLQQRLRSARGLAPAPASTSLIGSVSDQLPSQSRGGTNRPATLESGDAAVLAIHPRRAPARGEAARIHSEGDSLCHYPGSADRKADGGTGAARGRRTDCRT